MEITKTIELTNSLGEKIKNAFIKDIERSLDKLIRDYDIFKRGTCELINKNELLSIFLKNYDINYCSAATKNGTKCKNKAINNSHYCGKHIYSMDNIKDLLHTRNNKYEEINEESEKETTFIIEKNSCMINDTNNLKKILIEDSFYLTDDKWIYDKETFEKVGYTQCKSESEGVEYILSNDPFILNFAFN